MPRFFIEAAETVIHHGFVEADTEEQARELFVSLVGTYERPENYVEHYDVYSEGLKTTFADEAVVPS